jgi:DNA-binding response OmpR family regulator
MTMSRKILVVDDDHATRVGLVALLEAEGYEAAGADSLKAARQAMIDNPPDLLITDIRLGEFNGLHLAAANRLQVPVIVITGYPDPVLEEVARNFHAEFLLKPVKPSELLSRVNSILTAQPDPAYHPSRRWPRKRLTTDLPAQVDTLPVRVVDVSYGGLSLAAQSMPSDWLPPAFQITFPTAALSVHARVVWERSKDATWTCGLMVADDAEPAWHELVDTMS